jgi:hypothetical protein
MSIKRDGDPWEIRMPAFGMCQVDPDTLRPIITEYVYPPVPSRQCDWSAIYDGYEPGDKIGYGETEAKAVTDLLEGV